MGRILDFKKTKSGIIIPGTNSQQGPSKTSIFVKIDAVGDEVTKYKIGDVVVPLQIGRIWLRDGVWKQVIFEDKLILAIVEDVPLDQVVFEGEEQTLAEQNGSATDGATVTVQS